MALVRCEDCGKPRGRTRKYIKSVEPVGFPETAAVCGSRSCGNPGLVWLEAHEWRLYGQGERVFELPTGASKIRTV